MKDIYDTSKNVCRKRSCLFSSDIVCFLIKEMAINVLMYVCILHYLIRILLSKKRTKFYFNLYFGGTSI